MAVHSYDTTDEQEDAVTFARLAENARREGTTPPLPTFDDNATYVAAFTTTEIMNPLVARFREYLLQSVADDFRAPSTTYDARKAAAAALKKG